MTKPLSAPVRNPRITRAFGVNPPGSNYQAYGLPGHEGVDFEGDFGIEFFPCAAGKVYRVFRDDGKHPYGNHIRVIHEESGLKTIYAHAMDVFVCAGMEVALGVAIGTIGSTGNSTGPHLHLTVKREGHSIPGYPDWDGWGVVDPMDYLNLDAVAVVQESVPKFAKGDRAKVVYNGLNYRSGAGIGSQDNGDLHFGAELDVLDVAEDAQGRVWLYFGGWACAVDEDGTKYIDKIR